MSNYTHQVAFPTQKLSLSEKDDEWRRACVDSIIGREAGFTVRQGEIKIAYDLVNSVFDEQDLKYVTNPYKVEDGFPATLQNINIIRPKIELLKGEETKRPNIFAVYQTDEAASDSALNKQKELILSVLEESLLSEGLQDDQALQEQLVEIQSFIKNKYYSAAEQTASNTLKYLREKLNLKDEFLKGWEDALIAGKEIHYVGIVNGEPVLERVNPRFFSHDTDTDLRNIEDGEWCLYRTRMTPSMVYDRFYDIMSEEDLDSMLQEINSNFSSPSNTGSSINTEYIAWKDISAVLSTSNEEYNSRGVFLNVWHSVWKSFKKVGFLTYMDENGETLTTLVDETYKKSLDEEIEWDWITEVWEGYRIGNNTYIGIQPLEYQQSSMNNVIQKKLPYVGAVYNNNNSASKSLVEIMKPLQYMYIVLYYRLELTIARDRGKAFIMDPTQIPKSMGVDVNKWMHYLSAMGVIFVNPHEEGWDIPGREGGRPASFNQFQAVDLTMSNVIGEYINLMDKIEDMIGELSGVSRARQGQIQTRELVGNVERQVIQSSHITEPLFWRHNQIKKNALTSLLQVAQYAWRIYGKDNLNFVLEGLERIFLNITEDFLYSDFDIFVTDSTVAQQHLETLKSLYQPAMQNGASLSDIATIMTSDNISKIKMELEKIEQKRQQITQEQEQAIQNAETQRAQLDAEIRAEENRIKEEDSIRKAETSIQVALINAESKSAENGISFEQEKLTAQREKAVKDTEIKERQLNETIRANKAKESISRTKTNKQ